jgi:hypothetical protein
MRHIHATIVAVEKQYILHTMSVSVVLGIQRAMCLHHMVICGLPSSTTAQFLEKSY